MAIARRIGGAAFIATAGDVSICAPHVCWMFSMFESLDQLMKFDYEGMSFGKSKFLFAHSPLSRFILLESVDLLLRITSCTGSVSILVCAGVEPFNCARGVAYAIYLTMFNPSTIYWIMTICGGLSHGQSFQSRYPFISPSEGST